MIAIRVALAAALALAALPSLASSVPADTPANAAPVWVVTGQSSWRGVADIGRHATDWVDASGRALVIGELDPDGVIDLARHVHQKEKRCGGFFAFASREEAEGFLARDRSREAIALPLGGIYTIDNAATVEPWLDLVSESAIYGTISSLQSFQNRHYQTQYGHDAPLWIRDQWQALAAGRSDVSVDLFTACSSCGGQASVIMTIAGNELPDEVVVIGGHLDSINWNDPYNNNQRAPGADDDASGIATVTEIIRVAMASGWKPKRTVKFMGYAAEELGLYGSEAIADSFYAAGTNVVGVLQLDMTNYRDGGDHAVRFITDNSSNALLAYFNQLFDAYLAPRGMSRGGVECGYGCSDHASWTANGYPAAAAFESGRTPDYPGDMADFPYIHTSDDTLANMDNTAAPSAPFAQFGLAFLGELAKTHSISPPNVAPTAAFSWSANGMTVEFSDASSDPDGTIVAYHWEFGDGTSSSDPNSVKTYDAVGTYAVALTVTDDGGLPGTRIQNVTVNNGNVLLANGVPETGYPALAGASQRFSLDVPAGARHLRFMLEGEDGEDANLTLRRGAMMVCAANGPTANESCLIEHPSAGTYTATVTAVTALSGFTITGSWVSAEDSIFADDFDR